MTVKKISSSKKGILFRIKLELFIVNLQKRKRSTNMSSSDSCSCDSSRITSGDPSDSEAYEAKHTIANIGYELKPLNFATPDLNYEKLAVEITKILPSQLSVKRNEENHYNLDILYNEKPFVLKLKSFSGIIKRSREFKREKYCKIMDRCLNVMIWEVCNAACRMIREKEKAEKGKEMRYCWFLDWSRVFVNNLVGRPKMKRIHYFEDVCILIDKATFVAHDGKDLLLRLNCEMTSANSMMFSHSRK